MRMMIHLADLCSISLDLDSTQTLIVISKNEMNVMICGEYVHYSQYTEPWEWIGKQLVNHKQTYKAHNPVDLG